LRYFEGAVEILHLAVSELHIGNALFVSLEHSV
jgi:hypothetical protein